ncbi:MAG: phosphoenolpyruvate carboxylase [Gemmatimonadota bacterium]|nr:phosphoenolpyruvate carboxylase [Gemmatimonadota bacterium]
MEREERSADPQHLPPGLTATVRVVEEVLGRVVAAAEGDDLYHVVERVRRDMVSFREADDDRGREAALDRAAGRLEALPVERRIALARAYTLYLQLVNVCENAYRTHRLRERLSPDDAPRAHADLTFVLTAHPTESRSPSNIRLLRRVQDHVIDALAGGRPIDRREIENLLHLAWRAGTHPARKPSVDDEAGHLFSLLTDPILEEVVRLDAAGHRVRFRSWVGGDKDGHPGVGPDQTRAALDRARARFLEFIDETLLPPVREDLALVSSGASEERASPALIERALAELERALGDLGRVEEGDGARGAVLRDAVEAFQSRYRERFGIPHPAIERLSALLRVFPALVVPLELREERGRFGEGEPIADMMRRIARIADGGSIRGYARAVVVSMTKEAADLHEAQRLADAVFGEAAIPVVPLFELPAVLARAPEILRDTWEDETFRRAVSARGYLEVMLGYSDTAKRMGMLASRVALRDAMREIGEWADSVDVTPRFFHGHGGSVGRGGGRIEDLAATWPPSARRPYKYTVQGEMVERTLATPEILRSLVEKVAEVQENPPPYRPVGGLARRLAAASGDIFADRVASPDFRRILAGATPYTRLESLTIGSRPASRSGQEGLEKLRAIPWVLCWTQTRLLLHVWLGIGDAWRVARREPDAHTDLERAIDEDPLFRSCMRLLSFTLAKTERTVWRRYRDRLTPPGGDDTGLEGGLDDDLDAAVDLACRAMGGDTLLPDRPWLAESIRYRAPMIHPLNLLQIELLERSDWSEAEAHLFRETVTGIAAGMLTTG